MAVPRQAGVDTATVPAFSPARASRDAAPDRLVETLRGLLALASQTENCARVALSASLGRDGEVLHFVAVRGAGIAGSPAFTSAESRALNVAIDARAGAVTEGLATAPLFVSGECLGAVCLSATSRVSAVTANITLETALAARAHALAEQAAALCELQLARATEAALVLQRRSQLEMARSFASAPNRPALIELILGATCRLLPHVDAVGFVTDRPLRPAIWRERTVRTRARKLAVSPRTGLIADAIAAGCSTTTTDPGIISAMLGPRGAKRVREGPAPYAVTVAPLQVAGQSKCALVLVWSQPSTPADSGELELLIERASAALRSADAFDNVRRVNATLESVIANGGNPIFITDRGGCVTGWNAAAERRFGFGTEEAMHKPLNDLIVPQHLHHVAVSVLVRARRGETIEIETDLRSKDGATGCYMLTASPVTDESGKVVAVAGMLKDISLRKDTEAAIHRFNDQLKGVNDVSAALHGAVDLGAVLPDALASVLDILDADGAVLWRYDAQRGVLTAVTRAGIAPTDLRALERTDGASSDSAIRQAVTTGDNVFVDDVATSDLPAPVKAVAMQLGLAQLVALPLVDRGRVIGALELVSRRSRRFSETDLETMRLVQGQLALAFGRAILFDEIRDQKSTLEQVLAGTADGVYVTGAEAKFSLWNVAAARIAGVAVDEVLTQGYGALGGVDRRGRSLEELDRTAFDAATADSASRQTAQNYEVFFAKTSRWVAVSASPLRDASGAVTAMVHAFRDITAARELEQLKADFISTVSHELRTPLTSIKGATALLFEQVPPDSGNAFELLQMVRNNSERLLRLINDLLDASKIEAGKLTIRKQPCDPARLLERAVSGMTGYAEEYGVTVTTDFARGLAPIVVDPDRVEQIMSNLVSNAVKYSHRGDAVIVRARSEGAYLRVDVIDSGVGIPSSALPRLFEKFSQVDRDGHNRPGTGLGLVISKGLIEAHGGSISVSSTEGDGTTFTFTLPCAKRGADRA